MKRRGHGDPLFASQVLVGVCADGLCLDLLDPLGDIVCHAHGFDAADLLDKLGRAILIVTPKPEGAEGKTH